MGRPKGVTTLESWAIINLKSGSTFYSEKKDKDITAIASHYKRKVKTERVIFVSTFNKFACKNKVKIDKDIII